jgi:putative aminopeptidase FrvX
MSEIVRQWMGRVGLAVVVLACAVDGAVAQRITYRLVPREAVEARLRQYLGTNQQREATLKKMFAEAGCDEQHLSEQPVKGSKLPNVVCVLPGSSEKTIIVGAHFDHVAEGDGVVDNWSGASLLPSLYEAVKIEPRKHTYIFIGFTDEERGEVGSHYYARHMTKDEVAVTAAMVNMDTLGLGPTEVWAGHSDKQLMALFAAVAKQLNVTVTGVNVDQIGSTDSEQFRERKIPSITIHSLSQETFDARILHTKKDKLSAMRLDEYYQTYRVIAAYVALLDERAEAAQGN